MDKLFQEKVGARITELRKEKKLSQQKLAIDANIERTHLTHIEKGRKNISLSTLERVIKALETSIHNFFNTKDFK
jgi:transcriptional regulator with XRE-family HTH domain